jgi:galactonate dehydratase
VRVASVEPLHVGQYLFCRITTDSGLTGLGESGAWGHLGASAAAIRKFGDYLVGEDPLRIEHHAQVMYRSFHFRGAAISGAMSAIDIALWDIAGKHFGVPVHQLLGGRTRDKARVYYHVWGATREELVAGVRRAKRLGFTAVGHLTPFLDEPRSEPFFKTHAAKINDAIAAVAAYRDAVGDDVDLCIEIHRRLSPAEAIVLGRGIEPYRPFFYEDPVLPDNLDEMAHVAQHINIPIATGERFQTVHEFQMLLKRGGVQYVRPDVCLVGGLSGARKVAALAEASYVGVVPHNPLSPVSTAACLQLAACIPNFVLQELPEGETEPPKSEIVRTHVRCEEGFLVVPDAPGIGVELREDAVHRFPPRERGPIGARLHIDGSVVDQ